jgi:hypothetical protein
VQFFHYPITYCLSGSNIVPSDSFCNIFNRNPSVSVTGHVPVSCKTTDYIKWVYFDIHFFDRKCSLVKYCLSREILIQFISTDTMRGLHWLLNSSIINTVLVLQTFQQWLRIYHMKHNVRHYTDETASASVLRHITSFKWLNDLQLNLI